MSGQSVVDRLNAAKHSLAGQGLAKAVCKATTEEVTGPKRKHLDYLLQCTHEANVSVPQLADLLIQRTQSTNWVVVFKSLITVHNIMNYGNERYQQYMASNTVCYNLDNFVDKSSPQGYDMSTYIRKYAKYINEKAVAYRVMAFDFCKVKRGKDDGLLRTMVPEKLLKALPVLQTQIDSLLEFDPSLNELNNGVINAAFLLLFKDLIRLFACYNDGIINLLEKFFDMNRKQCKEALDIYKKFLVRMDLTAEFLKVAENVGIDKGDIPDLTKAPASLLEALEAHLTTLEGKKTSKLQSKGAAKGGSSTLTDEEKKRILLDEEKELQKMKEKKEKAQKEAQAAAASMESASNIPTQQTTEVIPPQAAPQSAPSASDDLLALDANPFQAKADNVLSISAAQQNNSQLWSNQNILDPMSLSPAPVSQPPPGGFISETGFASAFGGNQPTSATGGLLQPMNVTQQQSKGEVQAQLLQPQNMSSHGAAANTKLLNQDLDTSLASLAGNLSVNPGAGNRANLQWTAPTEKKLTGGNNFAGIRPANSTWSQPQQPMGMTPAPQQQFVPQQPYGYNVTSQMPYNTSMYQQPAVQPQFNMYNNNPAMMGMAPPMYQPMRLQQPMTQQPMTMQPQTTNTNQPQDPFGNL